MIVAHACASGRGAAPIGRRRRRRAVSPIVATVLLVAIVVVLAAFLYLLVTQDLLRTGTKAPDYVGFERMQSTTGPPPTAYDELELSGNQGLLTSQFGLTLANPGQAGIPVAAATACAGSFTTCTAPAAAGGWYAVLVNAQEVVVAGFTSGGWSASVAVQGTTLVLVSNGAYAGTGAILSVYGTTGSTVTGSTPL
jgi:flagellin-like protein